MKSSTSGSVKLVWMSLDRPTRSICLLKKIEMYEYHLDPGKRRSSRAKLKICIIMLSIYTLGDLGVLSNLIG